MKRGAPLKRTTPLKVKAPMKRATKAMPRESKKRIAERPERARVRAVTLERQPYCAARDMSTGVECGGDLETDEIVSRARRPGGHLDDTNTQTLCHVHNGWKEDWPDKAKELGLARSWSPGG